MLNFEEIRITNDFEVLCVVRKADGTRVFSDEVKELLYLNLKEKYLTLKAFKDVVFEDEQEERLYIAYNARFNKGKKEIIEEEVCRFFDSMNIPYYLETGSRVKAVVQKGFKAIITNSSLSQLTTKIYYPYDPYYKPYLLSLGLSEEDTKKVFSKLEAIKKYLWYRTKRKYMGVNVSNDINTLLDEFVCLNKDDQWEESVQAMKDYANFVDNEKSEFIKIYTKQEEKRIFREKVQKGEIEEVETKISLSDEDAFLESQKYYEPNQWKALVQLYNCGWNDLSIKGYKDESRYIIDKDELLSFINKQQWRSLPFQFNTYFSAIKAYLEFKWNAKHKEIAEVKENESNKEIIENVEKEQNLEPRLDKSIRIDINMDDIDEFLDYLERREPNRQQRERYKKQLEELYLNGWNQYKHNTFIDDNKYRVNAKDIEVFVNGMKSRDFNVKVKEYEDTIELYLSYRWTKKYSSTKKQVKEEAIPPQYRERAPKEESKKEDNIEGKKIFATINHYDSWKSKEDDSQPSSMEATTQYLGEATGQRKSASMKNAVITEDENTVNIKMELNGKSLIPSDDEKDSIEKQNSQEEEENRPVEQDNIEGSEKNENDEPQTTPAEEENSGNSSDDINNEEEDDKLSERIEITEKEDKDKAIPSIQKQKRKKGWFRRIIEIIFSWLFK